MSESNHLSPMEIIVFLGAVCIIARLAVQSLPPVSSLIGPVFRLAKDICSTPDCSSDLPAHAKSDVMINMACSRGIPVADFAKPILPAREDLEMSKSRGIDNVR